MSLNDQSNALAALPGAVAQQENVLYAKRTCDGQKLPLNNPCLGCVSGHSGSLVGTRQRLSLNKTDDRENPLLVRESGDFTDCPGRESNPHDRKRSQDFKSCGENIQGSDNSQQNHSDSHLSANIKPSVVENVQKIDPTSVLVDRDLMAINFCWHRLPEHVQKAIVALVRDAFRDKAV